MPDSFPQRRHPRYPAVLSIVYWRKEAGADRARRGRTRDVSAGGACLELPEALPLATPLVLAASTALGPGADPFRQVGFLAAVGLWLGLFGCAQLLTTTYPPVRKR